MLIACEHAGCNVPQRWGRLGLDEAFFGTHYSHDLGAGQVADMLASLLDASVVNAVYSRLFYDINRQISDWQCIRSDMGGIPVPGNLGLSPKERLLRDRICREPFDNAVFAHLRRSDILIGIHSFSPIYDGFARETEIGVMRHEDCPIGETLLRALRGKKEFLIGDNDPYDLRQVPPGSASRIQRQQPVPAVLIEIRNDLLSDKAGVVAVSNALAAAIVSLGFLDPELP